MDLAIFIITLINLQIKKVVQLPCMSLMLPTYTKTRMSNLIWLVQHIQTQSIESMFVSARILAHVKKYFHSQSLAFHSKFWQKNEMKTKEVRLKCKHASGHFISSPINCLCVIERKIKPFWTEDSFKFFQINFSY